MGDMIFTADRLPLLDPETQAKPSNLSQDYGDLCLVADGFAQVYPEHKYLIVECLRELGYVSRFVMNLLPCLHKSALNFSFVAMLEYIYIRRWA
jgi:hypothetical protein